MQVRQFSSPVDAQTQPTTTGTETMNKYPGRATKGGMVKKQSSDTARGTEAKFLNGGLITGIVRGICHVANT